MDGMSLLDVLRGVMLDPAEQAAYTADPAGYLGAFGYDDVDPADLSRGVRAWWRTRCRRTSRPGRVDRPPRPRRRRLRDGDARTSTPMAGIDAGDIAPRVPARRRATTRPTTGRWSVDDALSGSFGDGDQDFDDRRPVRRRGGRARPGVGEHVPLSEATTSTAPGGLDDDVAAAGRRRRGRRGRGLRRRVRRRPGRRPRRPTRRRGGDERRRRRRRPGRHRSRRLDIDTFGSISTAAAGDDPGAASRRPTPTTSGYDGGAACGDPGGGGVERPRPGGRARHPLGERPGGGGDPR